MADLSGRGKRDDEQAVIAHAMLTDAICEEDVFESLVSIALHIFSTSDFSGFVEGDLDESVGSQVVQRLVGTLLSIVDELRIPASPLAKHTRHFELKVNLFIGNSNMTGNSCNVWSPELQELLRLCSMFWRSGRGNPKLSAVCNCIAAESQAPFTLNGLNGTPTRSHFFYSELMPLSVALSRCHTNLGSKRSRMRKSGALYLASLAYVSWLHQAVHTKSY